MLYNIIRPILFFLSPEAAHTAAIQFLKLKNKLPTLSRHQLETQPLTLMGLTFPNKIGMAAGFDKNGECANALSKMGFGFVEVGTVTPKPQPGNPKPRIFRLTKANAVINRLGFNNKGVDYLVAQLKKNPPIKGCILGINIGKNLTTPVEKALDDYLICLRKVFTLADYITINVSSPNTPGLRNLESDQGLDDLLAGIKQAQLKLVKKYNKQVPLVVKISPDQTETQLRDTASIILKHQIDGVIATNTTLSRSGVEGQKYAKEKGGLSGAPLLAASNKAVKILRDALGPDFPIIGVGGIVSKADFEKKLASGASLAQVYTGFIYQGPDLIKQCRS